MNEIKNIKCVIIGDSDSGKYFLFNRIRKNTKNGFLCKNDRKDICLCKHKCDTHSGHELIESFFVKMDFMGIIFHYDVRKISSKIKGMVSVYIKHCNVIIICWNIMDYDGFYNLIDWLLMIYTQIRNLQTIIVVCGIKNAKKDKKCVSENELHKIILHTNVHYCDVFTDDSINNLFGKIGTIMLL